MVCERIANRHGLAIVREYIDVGKPARLDQQSELRRLLTDLERLHDATYVVVSDYARFGRDLQSLDDVTRRIRACGAEVVTITGVETAERFNPTGLLDEVAAWATRPARVDEEAPEPRSRMVADQLNAAVRKIRRGYLTADQREALAALVVIAGNATLPTPVIAAVFNVVMACGQAKQSKK
jgi:DNA invertase Pin-like site-specific DNA recombinase